MTGVSVIFHFGLLFALLHPPPPPSLLLTAQKIEIKKKEKKNKLGDIILHVYQKLLSDDVWFLRYGVQQMDGWRDRWTDRWTKEVTYRGGCPT